MARLDFSELSRRQNLLAVLFLLALAFFTYVWNFWNPPALFWDENYHIASAQKYLTGTFFMEPHPPLGKLFIALGEKIVNANPVDNQFAGTDYATTPPAGFSFFGYRLFPILFAWLTTPLIFAIFYLISRKTLWALLFSFLYVFDNALIVHLRSAMLESTMLFFSALLILAFMLLLEWKDDPKRFRNASILAGAALACLLTTKAFGLIFALLLPFMFAALWPHWRKFVRFVWIAGLTFGLLFVAIWQIHFALAGTINPVLPDAGYYQASPEYQALLNSGKNTSLFAFPWMIRDSMKFVTHYEKGVPRLDLCKNDENGSPWFLWPFGARTINYRWETPDGNAYRYLYLQSNPVVWTLGLAGVVFTFVFLTASSLFPMHEKPKQRLLMLAFFTMYVCYMIAISRINRVLYLYHYFLPLLFSFIMFAIVYNQWSQIGRWKLSDEQKTSGLLLLGVLMFLAFQFFRPFSFYEPLTDQQFERRTWLNIWELKCVRCTPESPFVIQAQ